MNALVSGVVLFSLGGLCYSAHQQPSRNHIGHLTTSLQDAPPQTLLGYVTDDPSDRASGIRFTVDARHILTATDTLPTSGRVLVSLRRSSWKPMPLFPRVQQGDIVQLQGVLRPPIARRNPADFDYAAFLHRRGIYATLSLYDTTNITVLGQQREGLDRLISPARAYVRTQLDHVVYHDEARVVLTALILGDRTGLEAATRDRFARTGLMHLLAVSGLHVMLVGMVLYGLLRPVLLRLGAGWRAMEIVRASITIVLLVGYMLLAGSNTPVVRAVLMTALFIGATVWQRNAHPLNTLGVAAIILLSFSPAQVFDVGFQLSFAAVAAIVTLNPRFTARLPARLLVRPIPRWIVKILTVSLAATLGTMPVLLYHFGRVPFGGLVLNLAAIPLTFATLASGLLALVFGGWALWVAEVFGAAADWLALALLWVAQAGDSSLGWASIQRYVRDGWLLAALVAGLIALAQWPRPRTRWRLVALAIACLAISVWTGILLSRYTPRLDVVFFDVGHGDAALVSLPNGRHLLIDAGNQDAYTNTGVRTLLPHLQRYGISHLDAVVISHPHSDHLGGLPALLREVSIGRVLHNGQPYGSALYEETIHLIDSLQVAHHAIHAGDTLAIDPAVRVQILAPEPGMIHAQTNDVSVVLRLVYGETSFLFAGDAEAAAEHWMLSRYTEVLPSDVIKVAHHGSRTSSTPGFVEKTVPASSSRSVAVVSVGRRFSLPNAEVIDRWQAVGATVWTTVDGGALWLYSDGETVEQLRWR